MHICFPPYGYMDRHIVQVAPVSEKDENVPLEPEDRVVTFSLEAYERCAIIPDVGKYYLDERLVRSGTELEKGVRMRWETPISVTHWYISFCFKLEHEEDTVPDKAY